MWRLGDNVRDFLRLLGELFDAFATAVRLRFFPWLREKTDELVVFLGPRWRRYAFIGTLVVGGWSALFFSFVLVNYLLDRAEIAQSLADEKDWLYGGGPVERRPPIRIYARDNSLIGEYLPERGSRLTMNDCSAARWLREASVSAEDRDFFEHGGVSYRGILRAVVNNVLSFSLREGGGTITQQVARNLYTTRERSFFRKLYETFVAYQIESQLSKDEILCLYLNKIYMGEGRIGAEEASWFYFRKPPTELDAAEASMIVGLFPSPVAYSPLNNIEGSLRKQEFVLDALVRDERLDVRQRNLAREAFLRRYEVKIEAERSDPGLIGLYGASRDFRYNGAPTANEYVKDFLYQEIRLPEDVIRAGGLSVYTTIDPIRQRAALSAVRDGVARLREKMLATTGDLERSEVERLARRINGVLVSLDAETGDVMAVVGGYAVAEGNMTQRVWSMRRQPGSSIKGFLYAVALDEGVLKINSMVVDEAVVFGSYRPSNWYQGHLGRIPLRQAVAMSINTIAVQTLNDVGVSTFRSRMIQALDLDFFEARERFPANLTLALGSGEMSPMEMARLYAVLSNGGHVVYPRLVTRVEGADGEMLYDGETVQTEGDFILSEKACQEAVKLLTYIFDPEVQGTARWIGQRRTQQAGYLPFSIAGKTGTIQLAREIRRRWPQLSCGSCAHDAWFAGLVPGEADVVWLGQDEGAPIGGGGYQAATVWAAYAQASLPGRIRGAFPEIEIVDPDTQHDDDWFDFLNPFDGGADPDQSRPGPTGPRVDTRPGELEEGVPDDPDQAPAVTTEPASPEQPGVTEPEATAPAETPSGTAEQVSAVPN